MEKSLLTPMLVDEALTVFTEVFRRLDIAIYLPALDLAAAAGQVTAMGAWLNGDLRLPTAARAAEEYRQAFGEATEDEILLEDVRIFLFLLGWHEEVERLRMRPGQVTRRARSG